MKLSSGFTCNHTSECGASISYTEPFPLVIIVLLACVRIVACAVNLKDVTTKWEGVLLLDLAFFSPLIWVQIRNIEWLELEGT